MNTTKTTDSSITTVVDANISTVTVDATLELEVRRSRKVRTGLKGGARTQGGMGSWAD